MLSVVHLMVSPPHMVIVVVVAVVFDVAGGGDGGRNPRGFGRAGSAGQPGPGGRGGSALESQQEARSRSQQGASAVLVLSVGAAVIGSMLWPGVCIVLFLLSWTSSVLVVVVVVVLLLDRVVTLAVAVDVGWRPLLLCFTICRSPL